MKYIIRNILILALVAIPVPAFAHVGIGETSAFMAGIVHPLSGYDHLLAMVAVGLWAGLRGEKALWLWPLAFVGSMVLGGVMGMNGIALPFVEQGILASVMALGLLVAFAVRAPLAVGAMVIGAAGLLHGFAHGAEAPLTGGGENYALGFVLATAALHGAGVFATLGALRLRKPILIRAAGLATVIAGLALVMTGA